MLIYQQIAFAHTLRCQLRKQPIEPGINAYLDDVTLAFVLSARNVPGAILQRMQIAVALARNQQLIDSWAEHRIKESIAVMGRSHGGCERIKNTSLLLQYDFFPLVCIYIYCGLLPFCLTARMGWMAPVVTVLLAFILLAMQRIGDDLVNPFENRASDVPLTARTRLIEIDLRQALGEKEVSAPIAAEKGVLY